MALVELGLTEDQFYRLCPRHTFLMQLQNRRKIEHQWEHTRFIAAMQHNTAMGKKRNIQPKRLVPLSLDKLNVPPDITVEEANEILRKWNIKKD